MHMTTEQIKAKLADVDSAQILAEIIDHLYQDDNKFSPWYNDESADVEDGLQAITDNIAAKVWCEQLASI
jgi:hypothetical protein